MTSENIPSEEDKSIRMLKDQMARTQADLEIFQAQVTVSRKKLKAHKKKVMELNRELDHTTTFIETVTDNLLDGLITIDSLGTIQTLNPAVEKLFGYQLEELYGKNISVLMPEPYHSQHDTYMQNYLSGDAPKIIGSGREVIGLRKDGTTFPMDLEISEFPASIGPIFIGLVRDITDRKTAEKEILQSKEEAEKANKTKAAFLSQMSHELRTPLNAILGFSQLMMMDSKSLDDRQKNFMNQISSSGKLLLELINDILDFNGAEAGKLKFSIKPVQIGSLVDALTDFLRPVADLKRIKMINLTTDFGDHYVLADQTRLMQVLINLTSNAIKFNNPNGSVTFSAQPIDGKKIRFNISDTGPGIAREDLDTLFEPFNPPKKYHPEAKGAGIGLTIAKQLTELMNGELGVTSTVGSGSTFYVDLPAADPPAENSDGGSLPG